MAQSAGGDNSLAKSALRDQLRASRRQRPLAGNAADARALADVATGWEHVRRAATVTAYVSVGSEPGTGTLLDALVAAGKRVLVPVLLPDMDLDWAVYAGPGAELVASRGLLEPAGPRLGTAAVAGADAVLVPGLAVSRTGDRLGQGGGCYDRALARVVAGTPVAVVLHPEEVGVPVPSDPHDRPVGFALSADGVADLRA